MRRMHRTAGPGSSLSVADTHLCSATDGPSSSRIKKPLVKALAAAMLGFGWGSLHAAPCSPGTVTTATTTAISFCTNDSLTVTDTGSVITGPGSAVLMMNVPSAGSISNSGTISGGNTGVNVDWSTLANGIVNSGLIQGTTFSGVVVSTNAVLNNGITNSGTITGGAFGIYLSFSSTISGGIINSGTITGGIDAIRIDTNGLDSIHITGNNTARFVGHVNAAQTPTFVDAGATYTMNAGQQFTVQSFTNNGTLAVDAGATGTITGNFSQDAGATFQTDVSGNTSYGKLAVSGTATLPADAKIHVNVANPAYAFTASGMSGIITAGTLNATTFVTTDNSTLFNFTAVQNGHAVDLLIAAAAASGGPSVSSSVAAMGNTHASGAAGALDGIIAAEPGGEIGALFVGLSSTQDVSNAVSQTLPLLSGGSMVAAQGALGDINRVIQARIDTNRGLSSGDDFVGNRHLWARPFGSWAKQDSSDGVAGYKANTYGVAVGLDGTPSNTLRTGLAFAYARSDIEGRSSIARQSADVDVYQLIAYGSLSLDSRTDIDFQADVGRNSNEGRRHIPFAGSTASSSYDTHSAHLGIGIGRVYPLTGTTSLTPSARVDYTRIKDEGYAETGAGALNLHVDSRTTEALIFRVDGKLAHQIAERTTLSANLGVGYDAMNEGATITSAFAGAPNAAFVTYGITRSPWLAHGGIAAVYQIGNRLELSGRYDAEYREDFLNQTASVKARWTF